jgi:hypothetical protein
MMKVLRPQPDQEKKGETYYQYVSKGPPPFAVAPESGPKNKIIVDGLVRVRLDIRHKPYPPESYSLSCPRRTLQKVLLVETRRYRNNGSFKLEEMIVGH